MTGESEPLDQVPALATAFQEETAVRLRTLLKQVDDGPVGERTLRELEAMRRAVGVYRAQVAAWRQWLVGRLAVLAAEDNPSSLFETGSTSPEPHPQARLALKA